MDKPAPRRPRAARLTSEKYLAPVIVLENPTQLRCQCRHRLMDVENVRGKIEIKCPKCDQLARFNLI